MQMEFKRGNSAPDWLVSWPMVFGCDGRIEVIEGTAHAYPQLPMADGEVLLRCDDTPPPGNAITKMPLWLHTNEPPVSAETIKDSQNREREQQRLRNLGVVFEDDWRLNQNQ